MRYKVKVKNRTVKVWDSDGNYGWAKCHLDDKFDVGVGFKIAVSRIGEKPKIGDKVKLSWKDDYKKFCDTDSVEMAHFCAMPRQYSIRFCYGVSPYLVNTKDTVYTVVHTETNRNNGDVLYFIEDKYGRIFCFKNLVKRKTKGDFYGI